MPELAIERPFALSSEDVAAALGCLPSEGLSSQEVLRRRKLHGPNSLRMRKAKSPLTILLHQFKSIIVWLLAAAATLAFLLGDLPESAAIVVVLILNGGIGFFTELRAARSMESLLRIAEVRTVVRRDGKIRRINARDVVPGDIVVLDAGDIVTADLRLVEASRMLADESVLTGESTPVEKSTETKAAEAEIGDRSNMVFRGTAITQGAGAGIAVATGMATEVGRISEMAQSAEGEMSPLEKRLDRLGYRLVWLTLGLAALTILAGVVRGHTVGAMIQTGIALAVAAVPEGLPVVATLCLARGMWRMAARNAIITRLSSVETLGATTLILTDKTGTLTENDMAVARYLLAGGSVPIEPGAMSVAEDDCLIAAVRIGALCNSADPGDGAEKERRGDPMEIALLSVADATGQPWRSLQECYPRVADHAFDPALKMMATVHEDGEQYLYAVKGAPESVIEVCETALHADGPHALDPVQRKEWLRRQSEAANDGLRLIALAMKQTGTPNDAPYSGLTLVALVCLLDPLREDVPAAVRASLDAGVHIVMLTGDHSATAAAIARDAGLGRGALRVIEGRELRGLSHETEDDSLRERILSADVFARVAPETKLILVRLFQDSGHVVAMTGDGVNDAPALKKADIGIAMGQRGTQVAQEAAEMVLRDDAFATIIAAMRQGRVIFDSIRKFVVYLMSCNVSEVLVVGIAVSGGLPPPLLPLQILFLNLVTDVFPAFALGLGRGDDGIMKRPPRAPKEPIVGQPEWLSIGLLGGIITVATLAAFGLALFWLQLPAGKAVTVAFVTLALAQLWNVFNVRSTQGGVFVNDVTSNVYVWAALALCVGLIGGALWVPSLAELLDLPHPGGSGLTLAVAASFGPLIAGQILMLLRVYPRRKVGERAQRTADKA
ncbi:Calcium-transporting ATPase [Defluviimonas aquaemixtae]|uniref:Calcium-transporting ATPase n=1 Tax=Albidovulum aquaemixtae TaxID=1542388 RepID=A0A2R8B8N9_9RHOB|nr:cation-transporting P-type ATPase [Defluviimonas aquaemixtae]SPH18813.1 Calcium-transporting ATPase [Defluviimonas aquaemixtae]